MVTWLLGGLETEGEYPYKGEDEKCSFVRQDARVYINGSVNISKNEDGGLLLFIVGFYGSTQSSVVGGVIFLSCSSIHLCMHAS